MAPRKTQPPNSTETVEQYRQRIMDIVCGCMVEGESLRRICRSVEGMPSHSTIITWCNESEELANQYARARESMIDVRFEDFRDSAAVVVEKYIREGWEPKDAIAMAKLECGNIQWELSKLNPKKYGDKISQEITGKDGAALSINIVKFGE